MQTEGARSVQIAVKLQQANHNGQFRLRYSRPETEGARSVQIAVELQLLAADTNIADRARSVQNTAKLWPLLSFVQ